MGHQIRFADAPAPPKNPQDRMQLCGGFNQKLVEEYWQKHGSEHATFFIAGQTQAPPKEMRLWEIFTDISGDEPDLTPQPTGNCVAAAADDAIEFLQCMQIHQGIQAEYKPIYNPFHYATGRELVLKGQLRGGAGSTGGAQAKALELYGCIPVQEGLPKYNKKNVDAWGDGKKADGKSYKDYMDQAKLIVVKESARITSMGHLFEAIGNLHPLTIASNRGYSMLPDSSGYHRPSGTWNHQMGIFGYSLIHDWVAIKNQWGDVHGRVTDPETKKQWPAGFLKVHLSDFEKSHFRGSETIAYSRMQGFPEQRYKHAKLGA